MAANASGNRALVIVESPTKARTIRKFLGDNFTVEASMGHVRDLPSSAAEIPASVKDKSWARLAVDVDNGFKPVYVVPADKSKVVKELKKALKTAEVLYVATDEDREGESIGWHLLELLKPKIPTHRMVFHEITKDAIHAALQNPRAVDEQLVQAQEARRILDRLVGYTVSPLLWKKVRPRLSAGRVQSVAVRLLVMRERERMAFVAGTWWDLKATAEKAADQQTARFDAQLVSLGGTHVAAGRDFDENTGQLKPGRNVILLDEAAATGLKDRLTGRALTIASVDRKVQDRSPYPPFTTSTLQQEANRKLGFTARTTMQVAQRLYENGHITYMRTDSVHLSGQAIGSSRAMIERRYGAEYLSPRPRNYTTKAKGAQEAHEAIRPAGTRMATAQELGLGGPEARLYDLIWKRTVATQMANAKVALTSVRLTVEDPESGQTVEFRASGRQVVFPGFFRAYVEGTDDPEQVLDDRDQPLPALEEGEQITLAALDALSHETRPPSRYTEATLVKALETQGIGRPSTYASIIDTIQQRGYVKTMARQLVPTFTAMAVTRLLEETLGKVVDIEFTASMESWLDAIAEGKDAEQYLERFYKDELLDPVTRGEEQIDPRTVCTLDSDRFGPYRVRIGRYGPFVEYDVDGEEKPKSFSLPEDTAPADVDQAFIDELRVKAEKGDAPLGDDPETGEPVYVRTGRFGPYIQLGEQTDDNKKPKRSSLPPKMEVGDVTLDVALALLALPRPLGTHPEDGEEIAAGIGRYGPYVKHKRTYASLKPTDDVLTVDLPRALELIAEKAKRGRKAEPLRELGEHPDGGQVVILDGRYGPYAKHGRINASLPKDTKVEDVTMEQAVALLAARAAKKGARKTTTRSTAKKTTTKKASTAKKTTAKKTTTKKATTAKKTTTKKATTAKKTTTKAASTKAATTKKAAPKKAAPKKAATKKAPPAE